MLKAGNLFKNVALDHLVKFQVQIPIITKIIRCTTISDIQDMLLYYHTFVKRKFINISLLTKIIIMGSSRIKIMIVCLFVVVLYTWEVMLITTCSLLNIGLIK